MIIKLVKRGKLNLINIKTLDMREVIDKLADKQERDRLLRVNAKWRSMAEQYLSMKSKSQKRWKKMVIKMSKRGKI